jgi:hypothetical protein
VADLDLLTDHDHASRILILCAWSLLSPLPSVLPGFAVEPIDDKWGPFRGQMVDVDTAQPVPAAVALAIWLQIVPTPVSGAQKYYDARVAVAGADGRFEIPRRPAPFFSSFIDTPLIEYFAPGYALAEPIRPEAGFTIVRLRKWGALTPEQRRMHNVTSGIHVWISKEKRPELIEIVNLERYRMGLRPIRWLSGGPE